jgi:4-hydroxy-tetrahydrodipicolinate reductase
MTDSRRVREASSMPMKIAITGAGGRMGRRLIALAAADRDLECVAALEDASSSALGRDVGELAGLGATSLVVTDQVEVPFDVLVEFSLPAGTMHWLDVCVARGLPMVTGTTGHTESQSAQIRAAAQKIPILKAPNMSVGVNVMFRLARMLGGILDDSYDVEIAETHHRFKVDAPSGTAIALRDAVADGRSSQGAAEAHVVYGRHGETGLRPVGQIGMHSVRLGDTVGEHTVAFGSVGETITIAHSAHSRDTFASGALRAAKWLAGRPAGLYDMQDVLFPGRA